MAAPRCARSFFGPVKRAKLPPPRSCAQTLSRTKSSKAENDNVDTRASNDADDFSPDASLDERLTELDIDPLYYKQLFNSHMKAQKRDERREPRTQKESEAMWKKLQDSPDHMELLHIYKRAGVEPIKLAKERGIQIPSGEKPVLDPKTQQSLAALREPVNVQAMKLRPLRRVPQYGIPVCDLQLRTYQVRNLELFADFAMRAAYYMGLPARGPIPLPRITERWTVPRSNFIFKKSQENFERITMRRLIQIQDGHPDVVKAWLAFLQKHQYHGVGMKANIWEYEDLKSATSVGRKVKEGDFKGRREAALLEKVEEILKGDGYREAMQGHQSPVALRY